MTPPIPSDVDHALAHLRGDWNELRGARLLVTGGTGFFGVSLLETFLAANERFGLGASALVLSRNPRRFAERFPALASAGGLELVAGDVRQVELPPGRLTHVIHGATDASPELANGRPDEMYDVIVRGTARVLDLARERGASRLLFVSSGAVYGPQPPEIDRIAERDPGRPDELSPGSSYGRGKRAAEEMVDDASRSGDLATASARGFAFVGPRLPLDAHFAAGNFLRDALTAEALAGRTGRIEIRGDGTPLRSYLHTADLAAWLFTLLVRRDADGAYNVGSDDAVSIRALAEEVAELMAERGVRLEVALARAPAPGRPAERYVPSIERARRELGLDVFLPRREAFRRTLEALAAAR